MQSTFNRLVRVSTTGAFQARRLKPSNPVSTRFNGVSPRIVDILGSIQIAVMVHAALWTIPLSDIEREAGQNVTTAVAAFAAGSRLEKIGIGISPSHEQPICVKSDRQHLSSTKPKPP